MLPKKGKGGEPPPPPQSDVTCPLRILPACFIIPIHLNALKINHALNSSIFKEIIISINKEKPYEWFPLLSAIRYRH